MNEKMDEKAKEYMRFCTTMAPFKVHLQPTLYLKKCSLSLERTKITCINCNHIYKSLYRKRTLKYWFKKDNVSQTPENTIWEESRLVRKRSVMGLRRINTRLLCNQCNLARTLYARKHQDTYNCPVFSATCKKKDHLSTFSDPLATNLEILEGKETNSEVQKAILEALHSIRAKCEPIHNI